MDVLYRYITLQGKAAFWKRGPGLGDVYICCSVVKQIPYYSLKTESQKQSYYEIGYRLDGLRAK